jgi:hypothetical protein
MPQIVSPSIPSGPATITERYDALVASGRIERDPAQEGVVVVLDALALPSGGKGGTLRKGAVRIRAKTVVRHEQPGGKSPARRRL